MRRTNAESKPWTLLLAAAVFAACASKNPDSPPQPPKEQPVVTDERTDLVLTWSDDEGVHVASSVAEVPEEHRGKVRVQDPKIPPDKRDPAWVFVADLSRKVNGRYEVEPVLRSSFEEQSQARAAHSGPAAPNPKSEPSATDAPVVMYATKTCPVCQKARRWLLDTGVRYIEKDIESDPQAMEELRRKAEAQGVPTGGVPVFDVKGKLLPGFDKKAILKALAADPNPPTLTI